MRLPCAAENKKYDIKLLFSRNNNFILKMYVGDGNVLVVRQQDSNNIDRFQITKLMTNDNDN